KLVQGRRPSMRFLASAKDVKGGIAGVVGKEAQLFDDLSASTAAEKNDFVNQLRDEVRAWREAGYPGTAVVTRRLLEWWFERDEERKAVGKRFFFCQQEAVETVIHLYEVKNRYKMPETGDLLPYALKLATGTGKTVVMALLVTWATLHKRKVSGSSLSANFLVLVPNLTVRDRVSGVPRGDGLDPAGEHNLYDAFETVPPQYREEFHPNVLVRNWQGIPLENKREDWIGEGEVPLEGERFIPQAVLRAMQRRSRQDPEAPVRRLLGGWRDLVVINEEAHHVYGEKRTKQGENPEYIKWSKILERIGKAAGEPRDRPLRRGLSHRRCGATLRACISPASCAASTASSPTPCSARWPGCCPRSRSCATWDGEAAGATVRRSSPFTALRGTSSPSPTAGTSTGRATSCAPAAASSTARASG